LIGNKCFIDLKKTLPSAQNMHSQENIYIILASTGLYPYLGATFAAVGTADELDVATVVLVATTILALESLQMKNRD
jgi:hypothetical protein